MMLRYLKEQQKLGWKEIAVHFPNRTTNACQFRWRRLVSGTLRSSSTGGAGPGATAPGAPMLNMHHPAAPVGASPVAHQLPYMGSAKPSSAAPGHHHYPVAYPEPGTGNWSQDEDNLIMARHDLRIDELSLLLPQRNETEIWHRRSVLLKAAAAATNQHAASSARSSLQPITPPVPSSHYSPHPQQQQQQHHYRHSHQPPGNYSVHHSHQHSSSRRSSVDPVTLLPPVSQVLPPPGHPQQHHQGPPPPNLHNRKSTPSSFDGLRLPLPVNQSRRHGHPKEDPSSSHRSKGYQ